MTETRETAARPQGPLDWLSHTPYYQAGLAGYSDAPMRIMARRYGAPYCVTEAIVDTILLSGGKSEEAARLDPEDHPIAGQLMGFDPRAMQQASEVLLRLGYDVIDVNLACPVKKMGRRCRGGLLLSQPEEAIAVLRAVRETCTGRVPCTLKLRRAFDDTDDSAESFHRILDAAVELGYSSVTVHGRTVLQKYQGPSKWSALREIVHRYKEPRDRQGFRILGSGDIFTAGAIFEMIDATGVEGVSVARGAIGNPWIFRQAQDIACGGEARGPSIGEQRRLLEEHCKLSLQLLGDSPRALSSIGRQMRKTAIKSSQLYRAGEPDVTRAFIAVKTLDDWWRALDAHYTEKACT